MNDCSDEKLPFGFAMYRVTHPEPVMYTFSLTGLLFFVWVKQFDKKYGLYESNRRKLLTPCIALLFDEYQSEPARLTLEHYLSINPDTLANLALHHSMTRLDGQFPTRDMKLFFERSTNALNDAERWLENSAWNRAIPGKRRYRN